MLTITEKHQFDKPFKEWLRSQGFHGTIDQLSALTGLSKMTLRNWYHNPKKHDALICSVTGAKVLLEQKVES